MAFPSTDILDDFNRADEGPPPSASWVNNTGTGLKVVSNVCVGNTTTNSEGSTWNTRFAADQEVSLRVTTLETVNAKVLVLFARLQTPGDGESNNYQINVYRLAGNDQLDFWKVVSGVYTQLGAAVNLGGEVAVGQSFGLRVVGTTLEAFRNGISLGTRTDSAITGTGYVGVRMAGNATGTRWQFDDFRGGAAIPFPGGVRLFGGIPQPVAVGWA